MPVIEGDQRQFSIRRLLAQFAQNTVTGKPATDDSDMEGNMSSHHFR